MKTLFSYVGIIFFVLSLNSCNQKFPDPTTEGKNTIGCFLNGKKFRVRIEPMSVGAYATVKTYRGLNENDERRKYMVIYGYGKSNNVYNTVSLGVSYDSLLTGKTSFKISDKYLDILKKEFESAGWGEVYTNSESESANSFNTNQDYPGTINITRFDVNEKIISGLFEFNGIDHQGNEMTVREGRFDFTYDFD